MTTSELNRSTGHHDMADVFILLDANPAAQTFLHQSVTEFRRLGTGRESELRALVELKADKLQQLLTSQEPPHDAGDRGGVGRETPRARPFYWLMAILAISKDLKWGFLGLWDKPGPGTDPGEPLGGRRN